MKIIELSERPEFLERGVNYFWKCWGSDSNFKFYQDCIENSLDKSNLLPKFYIVIEKEKIIGSYALLTNDIISRQDLMPWFACLYVNEEHRKQGIAKKLLDHGLNEAKLKGFDKLFLSTDLVDFYEKKGWTHMCNGFNVSGDSLKIYTKQSNNI